MLACHSGRNSVGSIETRLLVMCAEVVKHSLQGLVPGRRLAAWPVDTMCAKIVHDALLGWSELRIGWQELSAAVLSLQVRNDWLHRRKQRSCLAAARGWSNA